MFSSVHERLDDGSLARMGCVGVWWTATRGQKKTGLKSLGFHTKDPE